MTLSEKMIHALGLVLDDSKAVELRKIDQSILQEPHTNPIYILFRDDVYIEYLRNRREKTVEVYRLRKQARKALNHAIASDGNQAIWDKAYCRAETTASAEHSLFSLRMEEVRVHAALVRCGITVARALWIAWSMLSDANSASFPLSIVEFFLTSKLIKALSLCILLAEPSSYHAIEAVLDAANRAGIRLHVNIGEQLADSNSLICQLINVEDSTEKLDNLDKSGGDQIPDDYICPITFDVMTDPVANIHSQHRFERTAILEWLQQQATNPLTTLPLCSDDLRRDFRLKREITYFLEHGCQNKVSQQSLFKPKLKPLNECVDLDSDDEISVRMMAESAFGQGSNLGS
ncbi:MAG: U-box domain-containing protein [Legionellaceae bacterium]|nr:U-box domain-containing protein [Legionellaceae bacterium]